MRGIFVRNLNIVLAVFSVFLLSGCDMNREVIFDKLKDFDQKIGQEIEKVDNSKKNNIEDGND